MLDPRITANIAKIREYTTHDDLREHAHHFLCDKRYSNASEIKFIVMGINPGEPKGDQKRRGKLPLEETSECDFLKEGIESTAARKYRNNCQFICNTNAIALTEAFFWSSIDLKALKSRYGRFAGSPHVKWCASLNKDLIRIHNPKAVLVVGTSFRDEIVFLYDLLPDGDWVPYQNKSGRVDRLIIPCLDQEDRPWLFIKYFAARLSKPEKEKIREYVGKY